MAGRFSGEIIRQLVVEFTRVVFSEPSSVQKLLVRTNMVTY